MRTYPLLNIIFLLFAFTVEAHARTLPMPSNPGDSVVREYPDGEQYTLPDNGGTLLEVARRNNLGQTEIVQLNPDVDRWLTKDGDVVRLPNMRILPDAPRIGIVLNMAETRMYYYQPHGKDQPRFVRTYPIGIGREGWNTPLGATKVIHKVKNPSWYPPESIRAEHAADGDPLPAVVPPGPDNPLGAYAMHLGFSGYRIHGTDKPYSIGLRATHGCTRLYPEDIEELYSLVPVGTPVNIVNQPAKAGWLDGELYVEIHPGLEGEELSYGQLLQLALAAIQKANDNQMPDIDQEKLKLAIKKADGVPVALFRRDNPADVRPVANREAADENASSVE
jgi:L,D-transpeptidase ErfK/SrfK